MRWVFDDDVVKGTFGPKTEKKFTRNGENFIMKNFIICTLEEGEMGRICSTYEICIHFKLEKKKEGLLLKWANVVRKLTLEKRCKLDLTGSRRDKMSGFCEHFNEHYYSTSVRSSNLFIIYDNITINFCFSVVGIEFYNKLTVNQSTD